MPRTARLNLPGGVFHVVSRFARDEWWLERDGARDGYLAALGKAAEQSDVEVLAYCLMSNHVHLVVVQGRATLERFMKSVHTGFAHWARAHNRARRALGPVFAGRPRTVLVDRDEYLLELVRYVHNNPVRAGVARSARGSAWSSHQAYVGRVRAPEWLRVGYVLERFGKSRARAVQRFDAFVDEGRKEPRRPELSGAVDAGEAATVRRELGTGHRLSDGVLGNAAFHAKVAKDAARVQAALSARGQAQRSGPRARPAARAVIDAVLELLEVDPIALEERPRSQASANVKRLATWVWVHEYRGQPVELARALGIDTGVVSYHYAKAMQAPGDFDEQATAVTAIIERRDKAVGRHPGRERGTGRGHAVRYFVDVEEV